MSTVLEKLNSERILKSDQKMHDKQKNKGTDIYQFLPEFMNKVVICETVSGKTITGILRGYNQYELSLVEAKDTKSKNPAKIIVFKHGLVSIRELVAQDAI